MWWHVNLFPSLITLIWRYWLAQCQWTKGWTKARSKVTQLRPPLTSSTLFLVFYLVHLVLNHMVLHMLTNKRYWFTVVWFIFIDKIHLTFLRLTLAIAMFEVRWKVFWVYSIQFAFMKWTRCQGVEWERIYWFNFKN